MRKSITVDTASHVMLTVVRPNGSTEVVRHPTFKKILPHEFKVIQKMTKDAGRGEVISYENVTKKAEVVFTEADLIGMQSDKQASMMAMGE